MPTLRTKLLALALALAGAPALALMPPHVTSAGPLNGVLEDDTVVFHGYSLSYGQGDAKARDVTAAKDVAVTASVDCEWEGEGDCPGCQQPEVQGLGEAARGRAGARLRGHVHGDDRARHGEGEGRQPGGSEARRGSRAGRPEAARAAREVASPAGERPVPQVATMMQSPAMTVSNFSRA
jgi:hypothetical protein